MLVESYSVKMVRERVGESKRKQLAMNVTLYDPNGMIVWNGRSWHVANRIYACREALGNPPWIPPLNIEVTLARVSNGVKQYNFLLE